MESVEADRYVVLPCDMPYVDGEVITGLLTRHDTGVTAVISEGRHHPLVSVWDRSAKKRIREALEHEQYSVMSCAFRTAV